jgi:HD-GYP domain-containing protein (c-di-GMP phosphodiesterase class II)
MRAIPIEYIKEGQELAETLYTNTGTVLIKKGALLSKKLIGKIEENHIYTVYVKDKYSKNDVTKMIETTLKHSGKKIIKEMFESIKRNRLNTSKDEFFEHYNKLLELFNDISYELSSSSHMRIDYIDIKSMDDYLEGSALNTGILALLLGSYLGYNKDFQKELFIAGVLHDIGLLFLPEDVLDKSKDLSMEEKRMILHHPLDGYNFLKDRSYVSSYVKVSVLQHHEHIDGTGYPNRIASEEINDFAQIIGITDIYDAMTSDRPYRRALPPSEAIEFLMGVTGRYFSSNISETFISRVNPYPIGSLVELNTGDIAVVDEANPTLPLRPKISIIKESGDNFSLTPTNLIDNNNLVITNIHY